MAKKNPGFEESMARLEEIIRILDSGSEGLDGSLKLYEEGIALVRGCTEKLDLAEQKVRMLRLTPEGSAVLTDFESTEEGDEA